MKRQDIVNALIAQGYKAEARETVKNGVIFEGIVVRSDELIAPIIYTQGLIDEADRRGTTLTEVVEQILWIYETNKNINFNVDEFFDREFVLLHVRIGLQKISNQDLVRKESCYEGIEEYLYLKGEPGYSVKLNPALLEKAKIRKDEAWEYAAHNTFAETTIRSMAQVMKDLTGSAVGVNEEDPSMYVITNTSACNGASAVLDLDAIRKFFGPKNINRLIVLPSSIHEMLLVPADLAPDVDDMSRMVREINASQVAPEERLTDRAYTLQL